MKLSGATVNALRTMARGRTKPELKRLFAAIRTHDDRALLAALAPAKKRAVRRPGDPLVRELEQTLKPILGPAAEKADLLVEHLAKRHRRKFGITPKGLADAARQLRAKKLSDEQIQAGAKALVAHLAKLHGGQETVV
jgi:hypothetical protein